MWVSGEPAGSHRCLARTLTAGAVAALLLVLLPPVAARASNPIRPSLAAVREAIALNPGGTGAPQLLAIVFRPTRPALIRPTSVGGGGAAAPDAAPSRPAPLGRSSSAAVGPPPSAGSAGSGEAVPNGLAPATATRAARSGESPANSNAVRAPRPGGTTDAGSAAVASQGSVQRPAVPVADRRPSTRLRQSHAIRAAATWPPTGRRGDAGASAQLMPNLETLIAQFESLLRPRPAASAPAPMVRAAGSTL